MSVCKLCMDEGRMEQEDGSFKVCDCSSGMSIEMERLRAVVGRAENLAKAVRAETAEECAKILDGREWSARQGAKDAVSNTSLLFQLGEEKAYRDGATHLRSLTPPPAAGEKGGA
jgi:hypothetical protein